MSAPLGWIGILRIGLVQASLGAVVVLMTTTLNRVMVVEYALPASLPGTSAARAQCALLPERRCRRAVWAATLPALPP